MTEQNTAPTVELTADEAQRLQQLADQLAENGEVLVQTADTEQLAD